MKNVDEKRFALQIGSRFAAILKHKLFKPYIKFIYEFRILWDTTMAEETRKNIIRVMRRDLSGDQRIENALRGIKGVSFMMARAVRIKSGFDPKRKLGDLSDAEIKKLEEILETPQKHNYPKWLLNRRFDPVTGENTHILESDITMTLRDDLGKMKKMKSYRGLRHMHDLPVRGQRTRSTGRKNRTIGVVKKKAGR